MSSPRSGRKSKRSSTTTGTSTPIRSSPRGSRRSHNYPNAVNRHFVDSVPILEVTLRFEEDEYDVWRRQDTDEVNLYYMLRIKYPKDEDEEAWLLELEKLKKEIQAIRVIEEGWFEGVWVPLEQAKEIARRYKIYDHVAALLESENSWFDTPKSKQKKGSERPAELDTNGLSAPTTPTTPTTRSMTNGMIRSGDNGKYEKPRTRADRQREQQPGKGGEPREFDGDQHVDDLRRKLSASEQFLVYGGSNKRRMLMAFVGAAAGVGLTAAVMKGMGITVDDIARTVSGYSGSPTPDSEL